MAIAILKEGKKEIKVYQVTCCRCLCEFECDERDLKTSISMIGVRRGYLEICCPCCGIGLYVENKPVRTELL